MGEFGDALIQGGAIEDENGIAVQEVKDSDIVDLLQSVLDSPYSNTLVRQYTLTALSKLSVRFAEISSPTASLQQDRIREILAGYSGNLDLEIQQRAVEMGTLFQQNGGLDRGVLEHMPMPEIKATIMGTGKFSSISCSYRMTRSCKTD